jgi:hypothetical protein
MNPYSYISRRRMWNPEGIRATVTVTGSHQRTCVFGTITIGGEATFRCLQPVCIPEILEGIAEKV